MKKTQILVADFETTTILRNENETTKDYRLRIDEFNPEVYSWAIAKRNDYNDYTIKDGINIFEFIHELETIDEDTTMFFHNGSGFDNQFLIPALNYLGYKQLIINTDTLTPDSEYKFEDIEDYDNVIYEEKFRKLKEKEYSIIANKRYEIMELRIGLPATKYKKDGSKENRILKIWDTKLLFPAQLRKYGETLNKQYKTKNFTKLDIDSGYKKTTIYDTYEEFVNDGNEREYLHRDVVILAEFIGLMQSVLPFHKWRMTSASTAYHIWKYEYFGNTLLDNAIARGEVVTQKTKRGYTQYKWPKGQKVYAKKYFIDKLFNQVFPVDWLNAYYLDVLESNYKIIHEAYNGGLSFANPDYMGLRQNYVVHPDINSDYPDKMKNYIFPVGVPFVGDDKDPNSLKLITLNITNVKNDNGLPFLFDFLKINEGKHYPKTLKYKEYIITDAEFKRFKRYYKGEYTSSVLMSYKSISGDLIFGKYVDHFYGLKSDPTITPAERLYVKLMLNALYGKFGQDIVRESRVNLDGEWKSIETITSAKFYLPLSVWISAYARMQLVDAVGDNYKYVINGDTDAITIKVPKDIFYSKDEILNKYIETNYNMKIDKLKLGYWDVEHKFLTLVARRAKQYMGTFINKDGELEKCVRFAGMHFKDEDIQNLTFEDFVLGKGGFMQLRPHRLFTGIVLEEYEKILNPVWNYKRWPDVWYKNKKDFLENYQEKQDDVL